MNQKTGGSNPRSKWSVLDRELSDPLKDAFGHRHFAELLGDLIEAEHHQPPFSIGLLGPWGTGKSTIKSLYLAALKDDQSGERGKKRRDVFHAITFNAWRFGGDCDIKRALLRHAFLALGGDEEVLRRDLYQQVSQSAQKRRSVMDWIKEACLQNFVNVLLFLFLLGGGVTIALWFVRAAGLTDTVGLSVIGGLALSVSAFLAKKVVDLRVKVPSFFSPVTTISFPATSAEEYEQLLLKQIVRFKKTASGKACERLVIFVDDLDRLSATEMVAGLDAVRTFLDLTTTVLGVVFVISCDEARVAEAWARGRGKLGDSDIPGPVFSQSDARRYLDRLFQFRLEIPPFPKQDMRQFAEEKLRDTGSIAEDLEKRDVSLKNIVERLIHVGVQSPRNAIQILNAFMHAWRIAVQREQEGVGSSLPGGLNQGAVTGHPLALAAVCVLRVDFPDFYAELQKRPDLIHEYRRVAFGNVEIESLAPVAKSALKKFLEQKSADTTESDARALRRYMSSLQGLRWPERLLPLILLADDPISKKYGDRAAELYDDFVSGDTQGVLMVFGRHLDNDPLSDDDIRLLETISEEVSEETETRRVNAARVLAGLIDRIPAVRQRRLMTPLARQMVSLKDVRMNVGPKAARQVIKQLTSNDRQEVADRFARDLLTNDKINWRLPSGETPLLDQVVNDVRDTVELVLEVRANNGLISAGEQRLQSWILTRTIHFGGAEPQTLPFSELESWLDRHEEHLLPSLSAEYTDQAIKEFGTNPDSIADTGCTVRRIEAVHERLMGNGQESQRDVWNQLVEMINVQPVAAVSSAWKAITRFAGTASAPQSRALLTNFTARLIAVQKSGAEESEWEIWEQGEKAFLDLLTRWSDCIDANTGNSVAELGILWGTDEDTAGHMVRACNILESHEPDAWLAVMRNFVGQPFEQLPWVSWQFMASKIELIPEEDLTTLVEQMDKLLGTTPIDQNAAEKYRKFVDAVPIERWAKSPLQNHATGLLSSIEGNISNRDFIDAFFPAACKLYVCVAGKRPGTFLQGVFSTAAGSPTIYPLLHRNMIGMWRPENDDAVTYNPTEIVNQAIQFATNQPSTEGIEAVFDSILDLTVRGLVPDSVRPKVSSLVATLWPHAPSVVTSSIEKVSGFMESVDFTKILTGDQPSDSDPKNLQRFADAIAQHADDEYILRVTKGILEAAPSAIGNQPDGAFRLWLKTIKSKQSSHLMHLLKEADLNDEQRERVLQYAFQNKTSLGVEFFTEALPSVLTKPKEQRTLQVAIAEMNSLIELANTTEEKNGLFSQLIQVLPNLSGNHLVAISTAIRDLGGSAALGNANAVIETLSDDQLDIVSNTLPGSKALRRVIDERRALQESEAEDE